VLSMSEDLNDMGFRYPVLHPGCTGCQACQLICPDWVFTVFRYEEPIELDDAVSDAQ
jgi:2-oxoglutarate ferredoxin oxidoreductase subunit delta